MATLVRTFIVSVPVVTLILPDAAPPKECASFLEILWVNQESNFLDALSFQLLFHLKSFKQPQ